MELAIKRFNGIFKSRVLDDTVVIVVLDNDKLNEQISLLDDAINYLNSKRVFYVVTKINDTYIAELIYPYSKYLKFMKFIQNKGYNLCPLYFDDEYYNTFERIGSSSFCKITTR